jgi:hypothetical protein
MARTDAVSKYQVHIDLATVDPEREVTHEALLELKSCPKCKGELIHGFGLAFGGFGPYAVCETEGCDFVAKASDEDES